MDATKIGYEISFARYIYKPLPLRTVEQIRTDILKLAQQTEGLLHKIIHDFAGYGMMFVGMGLLWAELAVLRLVSVPEEAPHEKNASKDEPAVRESIKVQAMVAEIGEKMGFKIWIPRNDRSRVLQEWKPEAGILIEELPLSYDQATLKTIEQIDVLWLRRRSIVRAFEVEHTTSIYSGILRMADLLALQPNMDIKLHLVAPGNRREKVFEELQRPVFSLLERGPLADACTFISYDSLYELAKQKHLSRMSDSVLEDYAETVE